MKWRELDILTHWADDPCLISRDNCSPVHYWARLHHHHTCTLHWALLQVDHINIVHHFRPLSVCKLISIFKQNSILIKRIHEYTAAADAEAGSPRTMESEERELDSRRNYNELLIVCQVREREREREWLDQDHHWVSPLGMFVSSDLYLAPGTWPECHQHQSQSISAYTRYPGPAICPPSDPP